MNMSSKRIATISRHLIGEEVQPTANFVKSETESKLQTLHSELKNQLILPTSKLTMICDNMLREMRAGLQPNNQSSLKMIPSYITQIPTGKEVGFAYAIDMGGSNLRILKAALDGKGHILMESKNVIQELIPLSIQQSSADDLFDFIADSIIKLIKKEQANFGFTFSFPVEQTSINSGLLIKWTKGFTAKGTINQDVVHLLNKALEKKGIRANINALINDTVGTMLTGSYQEVDSDCCIGLILGTGSNACYWEKIENIKKGKFNIPGAKGMIINMESGNFGSTRIGEDLPVTKWDLTLNKHSNNPNNQMLEKQISGMYLGEIVRIILLDLIQQGKIFHHLKKDQLKGLDTPYNFPTQDMSSIEADDSNDLHIVNNILTNFGVNNSSRDERKFVKDVVHLVAERAAALSSTQIVACLKQMDKHNKEVVVAIDGSVFEKYPNFSNMMQSYLKQLLNHDKVRLVLAKDGSGVGAALASFTVKKD